MKRIISICAVVIALVLSTTVLTAAEPVSTNACMHVHGEKVEALGAVYAKVDDSVHAANVTYLAHCPDCGADYNIIEHIVEAHSYPPTVYVRNYHLRDKHYEVYTGTCVCGATGNYVYSWYCPGPPCMYTPPANVSDKD